MNSNTAALQTGHHHHHQTSSANSANSQYHHPSVVTGQNPPKPAVNPNPSVHRYNSLNDNNPWLLQSQVSTQGPTPPLRQHKRPAPHPPPPSISSSASGNQQSKANIHLSVNSTYNQPVHFNSAQTQTTPGLVPTAVIHQQHSPKSPNQSFLHQPGSSLMSTSLSSASSSNMVNSHHHLPPSSHQSLSTSLHHTTSSSLSNNNNNNNFDDLNLNGTSSISTASSSHQKKLEMKLNTMP